MNDLSPYASPQTPLGAAPLHPARTFLFYAVCCLTLIGMWEWRCNQFPAWPTVDEIDPWKFLSITIAFSVSSAFLLARFSCRKFWLAIYGGCCALTLLPRVQEAVQRLHWATDKPLDKPLPTTFELVVAAIILLAGMCWLAAAFARFNSRKERPIEWSEAKSVQARTGLNLPLLVATLVGCVAACVLFQVATDASRPFLLGPPIAPNRTTGILSAIDRGAAFCGLAWLVAGFQRGDVRRLEPGDYMLFAWGILDLFITVGRFVQVHYSSPGPGEGPFANPAVELNLAGSLLLALTSFVAALKTDGGFWKLFFAAEVALRGFGWLQSEFAALNFSGVLHDSFRLAADVTIAALFVLAVYSDYRCGKRRSWTHWFGVAVVGAWAAVSVGASALQVIWYSR